MTEHEQATAEAERWFCADCDMHEVGGPGERCAECEIQRDEAAREFWDDLRTDEAIERERGIL